MPGGSDCAGANRLGAVQKHGVGNAAHVPELAQDAPAGIVDGLRHQFPALHLCGRPDARRVGIAHAHGRDGRGLGNDHARRRPLRVILRHHGVGDALRARALAGERSHEDAIGQVPGADADGVK